ncbi:unnamed protein product [Ambrosiozyma monospora]|uniref:Unnamed protein product n=1 Tax=Ambrosiozyma monospora TaxID=43982 RepID=A0A9W7DJ46_AMBMO|nr:unnamed protein product [Ambrosiozyma monospora]
MNISTTFKTNCTIPKRIQVILNNQFTTVSLTPLSVDCPSQRQRQRQRRFLHSVPPFYRSQIGLPIGPDCRDKIRPSGTSGTGNGNGNGNGQHSAKFRVGGLYGCRFIHADLASLVQDSGSVVVVAADEEGKSKGGKKSLRRKKTTEKVSQLFECDKVFVEEKEPVVDVDVDVDVETVENAKGKGKGKIKLRAYQEQCIQDCLTAIRVDGDEGIDDKGNDKGVTDDGDEDSKRTRKSRIRNRRSIAVSLATGGGKTMIFANLIPKLPPNPRTKQTKTLVLVHRKELADQAIRAISRCNPGLNVRLEMGKAKIEADELGQVDVVVASVPTLARTIDRLKKFKPSTFKAIVIDECHHAVSTSFLKLLKYFGCYEPEEKGIELDGNDDDVVVEDEFEKFEPDEPEDVALKGDVAVIGFSATLKRHDRIPLRKAFDHIVFEKNMKDLINDGFLSDFTWLKVSAGLKLDEVEVTKGKNSDYKLDSLAEHVNTTKINELVLKTYLHVKKERKIKSSLFFCVNVQHMLDLHQLFKLNGLASRYVSGSSTKFERELAVNDFLEGKLPILFNCGVFTEGTDFPQVDSVFMVRPTKSQPLLTQMIGRGLRLHDEKEQCVIVDFVDASDIGISLDSSLRGKIMGRSGELAGIFGGVGTVGESRLKGQTKSFQLVTCSKRYLVFERLGI